MKACHNWYSRILFLLLLSCIITGCSNHPNTSPKSEEFITSSDVTSSTQPATEQTSNGQSSVSDWTTLKKIGQMDLTYATQFAVDYYEEDYSLITINGADRYLLIPEGKTAPDNLDSDIVCLFQPLDSIYLAASSAMDLFRQLDALSDIHMTGTKAENWSIPLIRDMMEQGQILYGGKYNTPDYELILSEDCDVAIESTMIFHTPEVKEQLEELGIPVMVENSSHEASPLGRSEWIRLYGLLTGKTKEADAFMEDTIHRWENIASDPGIASEDRPSIVFFYLSANGRAIVRKPGDYITEMIAMAGGDYVFSDDIPEEENSMTTMNIQMETFYEKAVDADILIYNSTVDAELQDLQSLLDKNGLLGDFKAVRDGNVWCTRQNMFQETTGTIGMIEDFYDIITGNADQKDTLNYIYRLQ